MWITDGLVRRINVLGMFRQLRKGPPPGGSKLTQGHLMAVFAGNLPPAFVKHCQFGNPAAGCTASMIKQADQRRGAGVSPADSGGPPAWLFAGETLWRGVRCLALGGG